MRILLLWITELVPGLLLAALVLLVLLWSKMLDRRCGWIYLVFAGYLTALFSLVGVPNLLDLHIDPSWQLIPFAGIPDDMKNSFLNVLLFMPLGFFFPSCGRTDAAG